MSKEITKIGIIGAGTMGVGISIVCAKCYAIKLIDINEEILERAMKNIKKIVDKILEKGKITLDEKSQILSRITTSTKLEDLSDCDLIIEAIIENVNAKKSLFRKLDNICKYAIFSTNTSTISITDLSSAISTPEKFIGMHFMNPAHIIPLVEIIKGLKTSDETVALVKDICTKLGKTGIVVNDSPGFVINRILIPMINEAIYCLQEGIAGKEEIDKIMELGANHPIGPLKLADLIGLDVCLHIMEILYQDLGDDKYRAAQLLKRMVSANMLGRKTGHGFYKYS